MAVSGTSSPVDLQAVAGRIEPQRADGEGLALGHGAFGAAQHRLDPQHHLPRAERLGHVVVRPELETDDAVDLLALGGQHDEWQRPRAGVALEDARHLEPVEPGQHQVEQQEIWGVTADALQGGVAALFQLDVEALFLQVVAEDLGEIGLVLDEQDAALCHGRRA